MERESRRRSGSRARRGGRGGRSGDLDRARRSPNACSPRRRRSTPRAPPACRCSAFRSRSRTTSTPPDCRPPPPAPLSPIGPSVRRPSVERLRAAGALLVGKTNLDQFATGLVGVRSPYGAPRSPFDSRYVSGGSSSGSAVAVSRGLVNFALGTDTAGSGRVPAAFCNLIGLKPSRGLISAAGVVPACQSLDCVSIFATNADDAAAALSAAAGFDAADPYSRAPLTPIDGPLPPPPTRFRFGLPRAADLDVLRRRGSRGAVRPGRRAARRASAAKRSRSTSRRSSPSRACSTRGRGWPSAPPRSAISSPPIRAPPTRPSKASS